VTDTPVRPRIATLSLPAPPMNVIRGGPRRSAQVAMSSALHRWVHTETESSTANSRVNHMLDNRYCRAVTSASDGTFVFTVVSSMV
jgi:hypothetical protein